MGLLNGSFYLIDTAFNGVRVAKEKLSTESNTAWVDLQSAQGLNSTWSQSFTSKFKSKSGSGILVMSNSPSKKRTRVPMLVVFSSNKKHVALALLSGEPDDSAGIVHRTSAFARGTFFSVESTEAHLTAVYDSDSGVLTFISAGYLIGDNKLPWVFFKVS